MNVLAQRDHTGSIFYEQNTQSNIFYVFMQCIGLWFGKICIFLGIIYLLHQIFLYLKDTFTTPKKTNIIQLHKNQYHEIEKMMKDQEMTSTKNNEAREVETSESEDISLSEEQKKYLENSLSKLLYDDAFTTFPASSPNATVLRSASEACNNGVLASSACRGLMTSTLGSS